MPDGPVRVWTTATDDTAVLSETAVQRADVPAGLSLPVLTQLLNLALMSGRDALGRTAGELQALLLRDLL